MNEGGGAREPAELAGSGDSALPRPPDRRGVDGAGTDGPGLDGPAADISPVRLPVLPGFREMALRRMSQDRRRLMRELAGRRQDAGLSQTEVAARMGTSQSAVARLEAGEADVRASTLERYAAALGTEITWKLQG
jgi:DNA-binding XRE family transcriptional regulator